MKPTLPLLAVKDWTVRFEQADGSHFLAVDGVNFQIQPGQSVGIVGESGSGKSLTALSMMQLLPTAAKTSGSIVWKGETDVQTAAQQLRGRSMGMIFQEPLSALNPVMRCGRQIAEALAQSQRLGKKQTRELAEDWLRRVHLDEVKRAYDAYPHELSGGQRQRVMIAMALCQSPDLLIADEPTTALDVSVQRGILDLLLELRESLNLSMLFISHDLGVIRHIAEEVMVMQRGKIVEHGLVDNIYRQAQHPYTQGLIACRPPLHVRLDRLPVLEDFLSDKEGSTGAVSLPKTAPTEPAYPRLPLVELRNVEVHFNKRTAWPWQKKEVVKAVDGVDLSIYAGQLIGLVGESGSGKTTLGRVLTGLATATNGQLLMGGKTLNALLDTERKQWRKMLQIVFQDPFNSLNPKLTVGQMLNEPLRVHFPDLTPPQRHERIKELLAQTGLPTDVLERLPAEFSGGQRQRIGIARALLLEPRLLVCDESVSALDVSVQAQILNLLRDLQQQHGFALLFITHDLAVVRYLCDQILVMQAGKLVEMADNDTLFSQPAHPYTRSLMEAVLT